MSDRNAGDERAPGRSVPRLRGTTRKAVLLVHIAASGAWLGLDVALGLLVAAALTGAGSVVAPASLLGMARVATWPLVIVGLLALASGLILGGGGRYGVVRYWWVAVKLVLNVVLVALVLGLLIPRLEELDDQSRQSLASGTDLSVPADLVFPPIISTGAVLLMMGLAVFKPWGRAPWGRALRPSRVRHTSGA